ncbi:18882_t:CDS:1, partial [Gigaspora rosea]
ETTIFLISFANGCWFKLLFDDCICEGVSAEKILSFGTHAYNANYNNNDN